jgi:hypothetical protein
VKWEHKLDTELDGSMLFNDIYRITNDTKLRKIIKKKLSKHAGRKNLIIKQNLRLTNPILEKIKALKKIRGKHITMPV